MHKFTISIVAATLGVALVNQRNHAVTS